jgi:hypothetical protein
LVPVERKIPLEGGDFPEEISYPTILILHGGRNMVLVR